MNCFVAGIFGGVTAGIFKRLIDIGYHAKVKSKFSSVNAAIQFDSTT